MKKFIAFATSFLLALTFVLGVMPSQIVKAATDCAVTVYYVKSDGTIGTKNVTVDLDSVEGDSLIQKKYAAIAAITDPIADAYEGTTDEYFYGWSKEISTDDPSRAIAVYGDIEQDAKYIVLLYAFVDTAVEGFGEYNAQSGYSHVKTIPCVNGASMPLPTTAASGNSIDWSVDYYVDGYGLTPPSTELIVPENYSSIVADITMLTEKKNTIILKGHEVTPTPSDPEPSTPSDPAPSAPSDPEPSTPSNPAPSTPTTTVTNISATEQIVKAPDGKETRTIKASEGSPVSVSGDLNVIPSGAKFETAAVDKSSATYAVAVEAVKNSTVVKSKQYEVLELNLSDGAGTAIHQLGGYVEVAIPLSQVYDRQLASGRTITVYRVEDDGTLTKCETSVELSADGTRSIVFKTNHFSTYIFVEEVATSPKTGETLPYGYVIVIMACLAGLAFCGKRANLFNK